MLSAVELKEQVQAIGADLVGVTGVDKPLLREYGEDPEKLLSGARSLISIGVALNKAAVCSGNLRLAPMTLCVFMSASIMYAWKQSGYLPGREPGQSVYPLISPWTWEVSRRV